jgi:hypothetical protein
LTVKAHRLVVIAAWAVFVYVAQALLLPPDARAAPENARVFHYLDRVPLIAAAAALVAVLPPRWAYAGQTAAMGFVFAAFRLESTQLMASLVAMAVPLALGALAWRLPLHRRGWKPGIIAASTALIAAAAFLPRPLGIHLIFSGLQFAWVCEAASNPERFGERSWHTCQRAMFAGIHSLPVPPDDCIRMDRSPRALLTGLAWFSAVGALIGVGAGGLGFHPVRSLEAGEAGWALLESLLFMIQMFGVLLINFLVEAATWRLLGVPVRAPLGRPWLAKSFPEYWRHANVYNYRMLSEVYFRNLFPARGPWMLVGVVCVFLISGFHHAAAEGPAMLVSAAVWWRWLLDGVITAATLAWMERRARSRVQAYLASGNKAPPRARTPVGSFLWAAGCILVVLLSHGLIFNLYLPDDRDGQVVISSVARWVATAWGSLL